MYINGIYRKSKIHDFSFSIKFFISFLYHDPIQKKTNATNAVSNLNGSLFSGIDIIYSSIPYSIYFNKGRKIAIIENKRSVLELLFILFIKKYNMKVVFHSVCLK